MDFREDGKKMRESEVIKLFEECLVGRGREENDNGGHMFSLLLFFSFFFFFFFFSCVFLFRCDFFSLDVIFILFLINLGDCIFFICHFFVLTRHHFLIRVYE